MLRWGSARYRGQVTQRRLVVRRAFDYQTATGLVVLTFFLLVLLSSSGGSRHWQLGVVGVLASAVVLYRPLCDRLRFCDDHIEYGNVFGRVSRSWPLDGSSRVTFDRVVTQSRWGRAVAGSLVLKGEHGYAVALTHRRYTHERQWSQFLLSQQGLGKLRISDDARQHLLGNLKDPA